MNRREKEATTEISLCLAQEGSITFKQLRLQHHKVVIVARQKALNSLVSSGSGKDA